VLDALPSPPEQFAAARLRSRFPEVQESEARSHRNQILSHICSIGRRNEVI
jgi:hypothetical protein